MKVEGLRIEQQKKWRESRWWQLKHFVIFTQDPWGFMIQFDVHIFSNGVGSTTNYRNRLIGDVISSANFLAIPLGNEGNKLYTCFLFWGWD